MNIVNGIFINDISLAVCIFPSDMLRHDQLKEIMTDYTTFYAHRLEQVSDKLDIVYADSIDQGLRDHSNYKHILFMAAGVRIYDASIIHDIVEEIKNNPNYFAAAHILEWKERWYELHHQFVLVNVENWHKIGQPDFGNWNKATEELVVIDRSVENFHDDYTPLWIKDTGRRQQQFHSQQGWNFIDKALRAGLEIINWNQKIRSKRTYYYPETNSELFFRCYITRQQIRPLSNFNQKSLIKEMMSGVSHQIWAVNTEHMYIRNADIQYEVVALPASGFKFLDIFKSQALKSNGEIIFYDYNPLSLAWIKHIHSSKSTDIKELITTFEHRKNLKWFGYNNPPIETDGVIAKSFLDSFRVTEAYFKGKFNEHLEQFRNMSIKFMQVDLINNPYTLISQIGDRKCLLHISNIFSTDFLVGLYGLKRSQIYFDKFQAILHHNTKIIGHTPKGKFLT
jgi:hypothetical protein